MKIMSLCGKSPGKVVEMEKMNSLVVNLKLANSKTFLFSFHLSQCSQSESSVALHINGDKIYMEKQDN